MIYEFLSFWRSLIFAGAHVTFTLTKSLYILSSKPSADIQLTNLLWISPALVPLKWPVASWSLHVTPRHPDFHLDGPEIIRNLP